MQTKAIESAIRYEHFLDCVHCGLCTASCPTYLATGLEADGPRGRIHLMRGVVDGKIELSAPVARHLELCLDCRSCESACPSGVQYGRLIEPFRVAMQGRTTSGKGTRDWFHRWVLFPLFPYANRMRFALKPVRWMQRLGFDRVFDRVGLTRLLPGPLGRMHAMLPTLGPELPPLPERIPAQGRRRAVVGLLTGCVADAVFRPVHWATARVLAANGCDVVVPRTQHCCGAIHYHAGEQDPAVRFAVANAKTFGTLGLDAVIVNVAGCGAMLKDYPHLPVPAGDLQTVRDFAAKVRDVSEFLVELGIEPPPHALPLTATYHDACHLCHAQQIRSAPRKLLASIPGLKLAPLEESEICCGAAGTYNLTQPEMAEQLVERKVGHLRATGAQAVFIANAGCALHIGRKFREQPNPPWIAHPVEALDLAYRGLQPPLPART